MEYSDLDGLRAGMAIESAMTEQDKKRAGEEWQKLISELIGEVQA
jgi:hypothetical protein